MFKINKKTIMLINTITSYNILASNLKFAIKDFSFQMYIYKLKDCSDFKNEINKHFENYDTLTYKQIQDYINTLENYKKIEIVDIASGKELKDKDIKICIKKDPEGVLLQRRKCILKFVCKGYELEDKFQNSIDIEFNETVNSTTSIVDYIKDTYKVENFSDDDFSLINKKTDMNVIKYTKYYILDGEYTIKLNKHVEGITKKKEDENLTFNISLKVNDITNYKLKNITTIPQFKLKKGSTNKDLENYLKAKHGIETEWIESIFDDENKSLTAGNTPLKGGSYVLIFNNIVNKFVEKNIKNPTNKDITLNIVPKDETKYELNGISKSITINVHENISYNDFINEIKEKITDSNFEVYVDNNKVENGNIDINKQIVIKLLDGCNKLKEIKKDNKGNGDSDGDGNKGGGDGGNNSNNNAKQKKYCGGKCGKE